MGSRVRPVLLVAVALFVGADRGVQAGSLSSSATAVGQVQKGGKEDAAVFARLYRSRLVCGIGASGERARR